MERNLLFALCPKKFSVMSDLTLHIKKTHMGIFCSICQIQPVDESRMTIHNNENHDGITFPCKICNIIASCDLSLKWHMKKKHKKGKNRKTLIKGKYNTKKVNLKEANKNDIANSNAENKIGGGDVSFETIIDMQQKKVDRIPKSEPMDLIDPLHKSESTATPYQCDMCDYKPSGLTGMRSAVKVYKQSVHLGIKHICGQCSTEHSTKINLSKHIKEANEGCRLKGLYCDHILKSSYRMKMHTEKHHLGKKLIEKSKIVFCHQLIN